MKKHLIISSLLVSSFAFAQGKAFKLTDTSFTQGSIYSGCQILYDFYNNTIIPEQNFPCLDSLALVMKKHPEVIWEIGSHTDQRGSDTFNTTLSQKRANVIEKYLIDRGVPDMNVVPVGYGESKPIYTQKSIDESKSKEDKERMYQSNRRTEFKALHVYTRYFSLTDSTFEPGSLMPCRVIFDFNKGTIRPESKPLLDSIAGFLIAHPKLVIEVNNHRDSRGSDMYSQDITKTRSKSVRDYFISRGVPPAQVMYKGYGETLPLVSDAYINQMQSKEAQEGLHQLNRRTELRIISVGQ
jgi:outer membrane protein OmpA-like peptidoglycan-associated protein